jgi:hypothetical protein
MLIKRFLKISEILNGPYLLHRRTLKKKRTTNLGMDPAEIAIRRKW